MPSNTDMQYILSESNFCILGFCRLLVGAPYEMNGPYQTGDIYKCSLSKRPNSNSCSKLNLGIVSQIQPISFPREFPRYATYNISDNNECEKCTYAYCIYIL